MRRSGMYFLTISLLLVSLLPLNNSALAWPDTMAHHDSGSGTASLGSCNSDMDDPNNLRPNPVTFKLCVGLSGATHWSHEIRGDVFPYPLVSGCSFGKVGVAQSTFQCNVSTPGNYRSTVKYWVNSTPYPGHADRKFVR